MSAEIVVAFRWGDAFSFDPEDYAAQVAVRFDRGSRRTAYGLTTARHCAYLKFENDADAVAFKLRYADDLDFVDG